jgi:integrase
MSYVFDPSYVLVAAGTGLRRGELIGLQWQDGAGLIQPWRSVVNQNIGKLKTVASAKPVAMDSRLSRALAELKATSPFNRMEGWVFASPALTGERPYWSDMVLTRRVRPVAQALKIQKCIGWHTFRRMYASLLKSSAADVKVAQESLRQGQCQDHNGVLRSGAFTRQMKGAIRSA